MHSVQPPSNVRPTPVLPSPAYLVRLTLEGLDAWTSNPTLHGLGDAFQGPWESLRAVLFRRFWVDCDRRRAVVRGAALALVHRGKAA
jgi:hypothetical protein